MLSSRDAQQPNAAEVKLKMSKVLFIGHVATDLGLCIDPANVRAITDMPPPKDVVGVQQLLGIVQYLNKFLPHLSYMTNPLRELTQKETDWIWDQPQQGALETLKQAVASAPVW